MQFRKMTLDNLIQCIDKAPSQHVIRGLDDRDLRIYCDSKDSGFNLKNQFKLREKSSDLYNNALNRLRKIKENKDKSIKKLKANHLLGRQYNTDICSFKLHVSLNNILEQDEKIIKKLLLYLVDKYTEENNLKFDFKIINPKIIDGINLPRFSDHDQITLYFDVYSSIAEMMKLCDDIECLLKGSGIKNDKGLGPKDVLAMNSFVSGRFDNNKLNQQYGVFHFFDRELLTFFKRYKGRERELDHVPLCIFEVIFHNVLLDEKIKALKSEGLSEQQSIEVQRQLDLIVTNPAHYITHGLPVIQSPLLEVKKLIDKTAKLYMGAVRKKRSVFFFKRNRDSNQIEQIEKFNRLMQGVDNFGHLVRNVVDYLQSYKKDVKKNSFRIMLLQALINHDSKELVEQVNKNNFKDKLKIFAYQPDLRLKKKQVTKSRVLG
jgi:hypothetical protein